MPLIKDTSVFNWSFVEFIKISLFHACYEYFLDYTYICTYQHIFVCVWVQQPGSTWHLRSLLLYRIYTCCQCVCKYVCMLICMYTHTQLTCALIPLTISTTIYYIFFWNAPKTIAVQLTPLTTISLFVYTYICMHIGLLISFRPLLTNLILECEFSSLNIGLFSVKFTYTNIYLKALAALSRNPSVYLNVFADNSKSYTYFYVCLYIFIYHSNTCTYNRTFSILLF